MKIGKAFYMLSRSLHVSIANSFAPHYVAYAHCDTLDGPVVMAARKAIRTGNRNFILIWVKKQDEAAITKVFERVLTAVQAANTTESKAKIENELFEALVKIHREGEGASYEGLQPVGSVEPDIALADKAIKTGILDTVLARIESPKNKEIITHLFHEVHKNSNYDMNDVDSGRRYVNSYVIFIHAVEAAIKGDVLEESNLHNH
jgi:hypothetical protein